MKKTKICPKCKGKKIMVSSGMDSQNFVMSRGIFNVVVDVDRYICCNCGYSEEWIRKSDIPRLLNAKGIKVLE